MKASYLIFDLDGTLIDSSVGVIAAVNYAFRQLGQTPPDEAAIRASIGYPLEQFFEQRQRQLAGRQGKTWISHETSMIPAQNHD
jgi:phosphoglycolate phosphatase-like HAD superfamily hydrolase